jgi:hypothetical protein
MPRKHRTFEAAPTESIGIAETDPHFGDTITVVWTTADATPQARIVVNATEEGGQITYAALYGPTADPRVTLGPTPTWPAGGGSGYVELVSWRDYGPSPDWAGFVTLAGPVPFTVLP